MTQLDLNAWRTENHEQLARVSGRIAGAVLEFSRQARGEWHMTELTRWVEARIGVAPDSPGRILRDLRQRGLIAYEVNRTLSLYRITAVRPA